MLRSGAAVGITAGFMRLYCFKVLHFKVQYVDALNCSTILAMRQHIFLASGEHDQRFLPQRASKKKSTLLRVLLSLNIKPEYQVKISISFQSSLRAKLLALAPVFPLHACAYILRDVARNTDRLLGVLVNGDHDDIGRIDRFALSAQALDKGIDADLHGGIADIGDPSGEHDEITQMCALLEDEVVDAGGDQGRVAVPACDNTRYLVDPLHERAAEKTTCAVDMLMHQKVTGFRVRVRFFDDITFADLNRRKFIFFLFHLLICSLHKLRVSVHLYAYHDHILYIF